jgi:hypothetical protein
LGARPGSASGCFKKATQIPKAGHPILDFILLGRSVNCGAVLRMFLELIDVIVSRPLTESTVHKIHGLRSKLLQLFYFNDLLVRPIDNATSE